MGIVACAVTLAVGAAGLSVSPAVADDAPLSQGCTNLNNPAFDAAYASVDDLPGSHARRGVFGPKEVAVFTATRTSGAATAPDGMVTVTDEGPPFAQSQESFPAYVDGVSVLAVPLVQTFAARQFGWYSTAVSWNVKCGADANGNSVIDSEEVPAVDAPGTPGIATVVSGDGTLTATVVPATSGGPVDSYTLTASTRPPGDVDNTTSEVVGSCTVAAGSVPLSCTISGLSMGSVHVVKAVASGPGGTSELSPSSAKVVPVTNAGVAELFRCDGAPGQPRSIPVSLTGLKHVGTRAQRELAIRMTPALPAGSGTLILHASLMGTPDSSPVDGYRFSAWASTMTTLLDPQGVGFVPNSAGDAGTGVTTTVLSREVMPGSSGVYPQQFLTGQNDSTFRLYNQGALFLPAPDSPYCADLRTYPVRFGADTNFFALARFLDDPRIIPGAPVVRPGSDSATVTITPPRAADEVTSYTVTASPGGKTCTVPDPAASLSCTITGLTALPDNQRYTFTSTATGPWGAAATNTFAGFGSGTPSANDPTAGSASAVSAASPVGVPVATPVTITGANLTKVYGEVDPAAVTTPTITGVVEGEALTQQPTCQRVAGENVGEKAITCSGATSPVSPITGTPAYAFTYVDGALTITKRPITVTPNGQSIVFGDPLPTSFPYTVTSGSLVAGDQIGGGCVVSAVPTRPKNAGTYPILCSSLTAGSNYDLTVGAANFVITKKAGVVTPDAQTITFGDADPTFTYSVSGVPDGYALDTPPTCGVTGAHTNAGQYTISCSGGADKNVDLTQTATATLTVNKASVVVTAKNATKVYGAAEPTYGFTTTGAGTVTQVNCGVSGAHAGAGEYPIECGGGTAGPNYTVTYQPGTLTVTKAALTLTADDKSRTTAQANPTLTYTPTGLVNNDTTATAFTGTPELSTTATSTSPVGPYPISIAAGTVSSTNYDITYVPGTLTVTAAAPPGKPTPTLSPGALVITTKNKGKTVKSITVSATLTDRGVGLKGKTVSFSVPGINLCTAKTTTAGVATCKIGAFRAAAILFHGGYTASFAGDATNNKTSVFSRNVRVVKS